MHRSEITLHTPVRGVTLETVSESTSRRVWAQIVDREAASTVLVGGADLSQTGVRETATFTTRHDSRLAYGVQIDDDLGRQWRVISTSTEQDRRNLSFECERRVSRDQEVRPLG